MNNDPYQNQPEQAPPGQEQPPYGAAADSTSNEPSGAPGFGQAPYGQQPGYGQSPYGQAEGGPYPPPPGFPGQGYQGYPPPGGAYGPGGQYSPYGAYPPPAAQGFNFQTLLARWQTVLTRPSVPTFDYEQPAANWPTILISLVILGVVEAISQFIIGLETRGVTTIPMPDGRFVPIPSNPIGDAFGGLIGAFIGFFVLSGIIYISAKIFGGQGSFLTQSWLLSLFYVPLNMIAAIAGIIPLLGSLVALATFIYGIVLAVMAVASAHRMTTGRATAAVLLPLIIIVALVCAFAAALVAFLIAIFHAAAS